MSLTKYDGCNSYEGWWSGPSDSKNPYKTEYDKIAPYKISDFKYDDEQHKKLIDYKRFKQLWDSEFDENNNPLKKSTGTTIPQPMPCHDADLFDWDVSFGRCMLAKLKESLTGGGTVWLSENHRSSFELLNSSSGIRRTFTEVWQRKDATGKPIEIVMESPGDPWLTVAVVL